MKRLIVGLGLICLFAMLGLTACGNSSVRTAVRTDAVDVDREVYVAIDEEITRDCERVTLPASAASGPLLNGDLDATIVRLDSALKDCAGRMAKVRSLQPAPGGGDPEPDPGGA